MKYILINYIKVQSANAIAGFTWGFPAITHFLGFTHNLSIKLLKTKFNDLRLEGCAVVCHDHQVHSYGSPYNTQFTQSRNPPYLHGLNNDKKAETAPVIEEGKMNLTVSLLIGCEGNIGIRKDNFLTWLDRQCKLQRLAGGTIFSMGGIDILGEDDDSLRQIKFALSPGFMLMDRSDELKNHYDNLLEKDNNTELLDAWLDFSALKQKARPKSDLISKHLNDLVKDYPENPQYSDLLSIWEAHLESPYDEGNVHTDLTNHFAELENAKKNEALLEQWCRYSEPTDKTDADWEYIPKPAKGYLVPIMTGYKAISRVYANDEVENTRDNKTDVCFVESVHGVGEWLSVHRLSSPETLRNCLWHYHYENNWYLCKQEIQVDIALGENVWLHAITEEREEDWT